MFRERLTMSELHSIILKMVITKSNPRHYVEIQCKSKKIKRWQRDKQDTICPTSCYKGEIFRINVKYCKRIK
jgi:hypothetical protein